MNVPKRARIIVAAWGESYVADLLEMTLPALLAPGNLGAVASWCDCELRIVAQTRFFAAIESSPVFRRLAAVCPVRLVALDDLIGGRSYGMSLTHAFHRGFEDLGERMVEYRLFFLNADFVLAEDSYRSVVERFETGERLIFAPSYCVVAEDVVPPLRARWGRPGEALAVPKREMASLALANLHDTVKAKLVNRSAVRPKVFDQFYRFADERTLLGYQMPVALVAMHPERAHVAPVCFWDYGTASEVCPTARRCVIGDSDEFLMIEPRAMAYYRAELEIGGTSPPEIAATLGAFMTRDQFELGAYPLTLHAGPVPAAAEPARAALDRFRQDVYRLLPAVPIGHREHPYWTRHERRFRLERAAAKGDAIGAESPLGRLYEAVFGRVPTVTPLHPFWATLRQFARTLDRARALGASRGLWIHSGPDSVFPSRADGAADWTRLSALTVFKYGVPPEAAGASLCVCELSWDDFVRFPRMYGALRSALGEGGRVLIFVQDRDVRALSDRDAHVLCAVLPWRDRAAIRFAGSRPAAWAHDALRAVIARVHDAGPWRLPALALAMLAMMPLTLLAAALEGVGPADRARRTRTSLTVEIEVTGGGA